MSFTIFQVHLPNYGRRGRFSKCHARVTLVNKEASLLFLTDKAVPRERIHDVCWLFFLTPWLCNISQGRTNAIGGHFKGLVRSRTELERTISQEGFSIGRWSTQPPPHRVNGIFRNKILNAFIYSRTRSDTRR